MKRKALTQTNLDELANEGCDVPGCNHAHLATCWIQGRCHPNADVRLRYNSQTGHLTVYCGECDRPVAEIEVAEK